MSKKILAMILATILILTAFSAAVLAAPYKDVVIGAGGGYKIVIEAEDFDSEDYAECSSPWGPQFAARPDESVATESCSNDARPDAPNPNYNVGWISEGDWVQYTVEVAQSGVYNFKAWLASGSDPKGGVEIYVNDKLVGYNNAGKSNGWQDWQLYNIGTVEMTKGTNVIKALFPEGGVNLDAIEVILTQNAAAELINIDKDTAGDWIDVYGEDGYVIVTSDNSIDFTPDYANITYGNESGGFPAFWEWWNSNSGDHDNSYTALYTSADKDYQTAACYYSGDYVTIDIDIMGAQSKIVTFYMNDFDSYNRGADIYVLDANGKDLDDVVHIESGDYVGGWYLSYIVSGSVQFKFDCLSGNVVIAGIFFDSIPAPELLPDLPMEDALNLGELYAASVAVMSVLLPDVSMGDAKDLSDIMTIAKKVGIFKDSDVTIYNRYFNDPKRILERRIFDLKNIATRQDYAFIISRMFDILKVRGIEYKVWVASNDGQKDSIGFRGLGRSVASSSTIAKGSGNGSGTSRNIGGDDSLDYYRDYKDLYGMYEKAYVFALSIGVIETKFYDDIICKNFDKNFEPRTIIEYVDGEPVLVNVEKFLAPNDPVTYGDILNNLAPLFDENKFVLTDYAQIIKDGPTAPVTRPAPALADDDKDEADAE